MGTKQNPKTYRKLDTELMGEIADYVVTVVRKEDKRIIEKTYEERKNYVRKLLRMYRSLHAHSALSIYDASHFSEDEDIANILKDLGWERKEAFKVDSIKKSIVKTKIILDHVDAMLEAYKWYCEKSVRAEIKRRYRIINAMYIEPEIMTADEVAARENIDRSTLYRDIDAAVGRISVLLFGVEM